MKRIISITIALCLVFCSILPVYAESWTSQQANLVTQGTTGILSMLTQLRTDIVQWMTLTGSGGQGLGATFQDQYILLSHIADWLVPTGARGANEPTLLDTIVVLTNYAMNHLPDISSIAGYVASWMSSNNSYLNQLQLGLTNQSSYNWGDAWQYDYVRKNAHWYLLDERNGIRDGGYHLKSVNSDGTNNTGYLFWQEGSPLGNIAVLLRHFEDNFVNAFSYRWLADLRHYNDNLTTWDSQGSTLTQVGFTPESAIQGLYRYLAFTQRDVARLAYVFANDEELEARQLAQANQEEVLDEFIDPSGSGSVSTTDIGSISDLSSGYKSNFGSDASVSGIFNIFNSNNMGWFSQETANQLDTTTPTRRGSSFDTPLLDQQIIDIYDQIGVVND